MHSELVHAIHACLAAYILTTFGPSHNAPPSDTAVSGGANRPNRSACLLGLCGFRPLRGQAITAGLGTAHLHEMLAQQRVGAQRYSSTLGALAIGRLLGRGERVPPRPC